MGCNSSQVVVRIPGPEVSGTQHTNPGRSKAHTSGVRWPDIVSPSWNNDKVIVLLEKALSEYNGLAFPSKTSSGERLSDTIVKCVKGLFQTVSIVFEPASIVVELLDTVYSGASAELISAYQKLGVQIKSLIDVARKHVQICVDNKVQISYRFVEFATVCLEHAEAAHYTMSKHKGLCRWRNTNKLLEDINDILVETERLKSNLEFEELLGTAATTTGISVKIDMLSKNIEAMVTGQRLGKEDNIFQNITKEMFQRLMMTYNKGFVGRSWLFHEIKRWMDSSNELASNQMLVLVGEVGIGKSAVLFQLALNRDWGIYKHVVAIYACNAIEGVTEKANAFIYSMVKQLANNVDGFHEVLLGSTGMDTVEEYVNMVMNTENSLIRGQSFIWKAVSELLLNPLALLDSPNIKPLIWLVDGTDLSIHTDINAVSCVSVATLLMSSEFLSRLPKWLRIVTTSRIITRQPAIRTVLLEAAHVENQRDVCSFIEISLMKLYDSGSAKKTIEQRDLHYIARNLVVKSSGNFLWASCVINDMQEVSANQWNHLMKLPSGLYSFYQFSFQARFTNLEEYQRQARPVLALVIVLGSVSRAVLHGAISNFGCFGCTVGQCEYIINTTIEKMAGLMLVDDAGYIRLHHRSLTEWLCTPQHNMTNKMNFFVDKSQGHAIFSAFLMSIMKNPKSNRLCPPWEWLQATGLVDRKLEAPKCGSTCLRCSSIQISLGQSFSAQLAKVVLMCVQHMVRSFGGVASLSDLAMYLKLSVPNISSRDGRGWDALHYACYSGDSTAAEILMLAGCDVQGEIDAQWTPLALASFGGHSGLCKILLDHGANRCRPVTTEGWIPIMGASNNGFIDTIRVLLRQAQKSEESELARMVNFTSRQNQTALMLASKRGYLNAVHILLQSNADVNCKTINGTTALAFAAHHGYCEIARLLIKHNAHVEDSNMGDSPLAFAVCAGHEEMVDLLLKLIPQTKVNSKEENLLVLACARGNSSIVDSLLCGRADPNSATFAGVTPLMSAASRGHREIVLQLLYANAKVGTLDLQGASALHYAIDRGHSQVVQDLLTKADVNVNVPRDDGVTPLMLASHLGHEHIVQELLIASADANAVKPSGRNALMLACHAGRTGVAKMLIDSGAAVNQKKWNGRTALMYAAQGGHASLVRLLLESGSRLWDKKMNGKQAADFAKQSDVKMELHSGS